MCTIRVVNEIEQNGRDKTNASERRVESCNMDQPICLQYIRTSSFSDESFHSLSLLCSKLRRWKRNTSEMSAMMEYISTLNNLNLHLRWTVSFLPYSCWITWRKLEDMLRKSKLARNRSEMTSKLSMSLSAAVDATSSSAVDVRRPILATARLRDRILHQQSNQQKSGR